MLQILSLETSLKEIANDSMCQLRDQITNGSYRTSNKFYFHTRADFLQTHLLLCLDTN
jgi:hypothetical protein